MTRTPATRPVTAPVTVRGTVLGAGRPKVIVPLTGRTVPALLDQARDVVAAGPDLVEWRVDHLGPGDAAPGDAAPADVVAAGRELRAALGRLPLLVTIRTAAEGGLAAVADADYVAVYRAVLEAGLADLVDVEVMRDEATVRTLVDLAHAAGALVVASNHDFDATPPQEEIVRRLLHMADRGADVLKIAVMPHDPGDVLALLAATWEASGRTERPLITMAMAGTGVASRVAGGVFGSAATFGTVGAASAPGQVELGALRAALAVVHPG
ncbi:type I 3-dehydroquinate dehydratase [Cellulomonas hominis]|uniref:type I 3-dehydroquinate dehydratase n=1 Tax=Cellulomonas hominis TaxID=156981 RepID=UPI00144440B4|nr:type I 3-dehydroquinate dehydratase [Cellulomonas hominis]NKY10028.1 type I 3-dehydroquinate dehydratase [Cellulomonas hominis]